MNDFIHRRGIVALAIGVTLLTGACGKDAGSPANGATATAAHKAGDSEGEAGHVIVVQLTSDATGNSFTPSEMGANIHSDRAPAATNVPSAPPKNCWKTAPV